MENASEVVPQEVSVRLDWSDAEAAATQHVNQLIGQVGPPTGDGTPDGIYLGIGSIAPPVILGTPEEMKLRGAQLEGTSIKVTVHGRYHVSRGFVDAMIKALQTTAAQYDATVQHAATRGSETEVTP